MTFMFRKALMAGLFFACVGAAYAGEAHANGASAASSVRVQVNDELVAFPDAQPFIDETGSVLVPIRLLSEKLGYKVDWSANGQDVTVFVKGMDKKLMLRTDETDMLVDRKTVKLDAAARFIEGRVYVPVRDISEAFGMNVQWDDDNSIAIVDADGKYHSPAWYKPKPQPQVTIASVQSEADQLLDTAAEYSGTKYVWGGTTPRGFDCSGYVGYIFNQYGIDLPRTSAEMFASAGTRVSEVQPGDLVFFARGKSVFHVGIYVGDGQFISATKSKGVFVNPLYSGYWGTYYIGAKRVL